MQSQLHGFFPEIPMIFFLLYRGRGVVIQVIKSHNFWITYVEESGLRASNALRYTVTLTV